MHVHTLCLRWSITWAEMLAMALRMVDWMKVVVNGDNLLMVAVTDGQLSVDNISKTEGALP